MERGVGSESSGELNLIAFGAERKAGSEGHQRQSSMRTIANNAQVQQWRQYEVQNSNREPTQQ